MQALQSTIPETLVATYTDGPTLTAAATATAIPSYAKITLPAGFFYVGRVLRIKATGRISTVITTPGLPHFLVVVGAVTAFDSGAFLPDTVVGHTTVGWMLDLLLTCRAEGNGTSANLIGQGIWTCEDLLGTPASPPKGVLSAILPWNTAPAVGTGFDSTVSNTLDFQYTQNVATGSFTVHQYVVTAEK